MNPKQAIQIKPGWQKNKRKKERKKEKQIQK